MRKIIIALAIIVGSLTLNGCFTFDAVHNQHIIAIFKSDIVQMHEDVDFILAMEEENPLDGYYR